MSDTLIHYPLYIGDTLKKFIDFPSLEQRGAWLSITVALVQNDGFLPDDDSLYFKCLCFSEQDKHLLKQMLAKCLSKTNKGWESKEINLLIEKQKDLREKRRIAGQAGGKSRKFTQAIAKASAKANNKQLLKQSESESESELNTELESKSNLKKIDSDSKNKFKNRFDWRIEENIQHETHLEAEAQAKIYGENLENLFKKFNEFLEFVPHSPDRAFLGWIKSYCNSKQENKANEALVKNTSPPLKTHLEVDKNGFDFLKWNSIFLSKGGSLVFTDKEQEYYNKFEKQGFARRALNQQRGGIRKTVF